MGAGGLAVDVAIELWALAPLDRPPPAYDRSVEGAGRALAIATHVAVVFVAMVPGGAVVRLTLLETARAVELESMAKAETIASLEDPDALVRGRAMHSLTARFELDALRRDAAGHTVLESPLEVLEMLLMCPLAPLWQYAAWQIRVMFQALNVGVSPDAFSLRYLPTAPEGFRERVVTNFFDDEVPLDIGPVLAAWGVDRRWAEAFFAVQLAHRSQRAVQAIAALRAEWLAGALESSREGADAAYRAAVDKALAWFAA